MGKLVAADHTSYQSLKEGKLQVSVCLGSLVLIAGCELPTVAFSLDVRAPTFFFQYGYRATCLDVRNSLAVVVVVVVVRSSRLFRRPCRSDESKRAQEGFFFFSRPRRSLARPSLASLSSRLSPPVTIRSLFAPVNIQRCR